MSIDDVKSRLIGALNEIKYADRAQFFKDHCIKFASAKAFWFGVCNALAKRTVNLIEKQLNERYQNSSEPQQQTSGQNENNVVKILNEFLNELTNDINKNKQELLSTPVETQTPQLEEIDNFDLNTNLACVQKLSSTIDTQISMLTQAIVLIPYVNLAQPTIMLAGKLNAENKRPVIPVNAKNIDKELFEPFKASIYNSIQQLNKLDWENLTTSDREKLQTAINEAKQKAKTNIKKAFDEASKAIDIISKGHTSEMHDPKNTNKEYFYLIKQVKELLVQARALLSIQGNPNFDDLEKFAEVWAKNEISNIMFEYDKKSDADIQDWLSNQSKIIKETKKKLLQIIPEKNKNALTALIDNTITQAQINDIARLKNDAERIDALNKILQENLLKENMEQNEEFLRENM